MTHRAIIVAELAKVIPAARNSSVMRIAPGGRYTIGYHSRRFSTTRCLSKSGTDISRVDNQRDCWQTLQPLSRRSFREAFDRECQRGRFGPRLFGVS